MHGSQSMMKACMQSAGIHQMGHSQLLDVTQSLEVRMLNKIEYQFCGDADKTVYRIVYDFLFIQGVICATKMLNNSNILFYNC